MKPHHLILAAFFGVSGTIWPAHAATSNSDPALNLSVGAVNQGVVLSWFASNAVAYQVESSSTLTAWSNSSPVITGSGSSLLFTNPVPGTSHGFFRVKRLVPLDATSASFDPATGILTIVGDDLANVIVVSRDAAGALRVNNGVVPISGGAPTVANTVLIQIFGRAGDDQLSLDESNGVLPRAQLFGEDGDDTLTGGSNADVLNGGAGSDVLSGQDGADNLLGGDEHDTLTGGGGDDIALLGVGEDHFIWNPGDGTDLVEGGDGIDTVEVNGGDDAEFFTTTANGTRVRFDRIDATPFALDLGTCERLVLNAGGGNDQFAATGNLAALIQITVEGGAGEDILSGSNGTDLLVGGDGNDFIDGQQGNDLVRGGAGDDVFQWDPGDGSDTIEGEEDHDTLSFNGSGGNELFDVSANGPRLRFTRNLANIALDLDAVEQLDLRALGGTDSLTVNNLAGAGLAKVNVFLAGTLGGANGDAQPDTVILNGTEVGETVNITNSSRSIGVSGLSVGVAIFNAEGTNDVLVVNMLGGNDTVTASALEAGIIKLTVNGGADHDSIEGSRGVDLLTGGDGDDLFVWNPSGGSDVVEGQAGTDELLFNGLATGENLDINANGPRLYFFAGSTNALLNVDDVQRIRVNMHGGADNLVIGDLQSTDVTHLLVDLAAAEGGGDAQLDSVVINGTQTNDTIVVNGSPGTVAVAGLFASVTITNGEPANDRLTINALGGHDGVDATDLVTNTIKLTLNGGLGDDELIGSQGADFLNGGDGDDGIYGGDGDDTLTWNPGDDNDTFNGQTGTDTLLFNGANVAETIDLSANGSRLRFFRNIANVTMDCDDVERVHYNALGGADLIFVNNLTATDVTSVSIALGGTLGTGDAQPDSVFVHGTATNDTVTISGSVSNVMVAGLPATVTITGSEGAHDSLVLALFAGDDAMDASRLIAGLLTLTCHGGADDDVLIGSDGSDVLLGEDGDDVLLGGPGLDSLDGGLGNNIVIQD